MWPCQCSALVLLKQPVATLARVWATSSAAPGSGPVGQSWKAARNAAGLSSSCQSATTPAAKSVSEQRPLSKRRTQRQVSQRRHSSSSLAMPVSSSMARTPATSMSTPPRSNSTKSTGSATLQTYWAAPPRPRSSGHTGAQPACSPPAAGNVRGLGGTAAKCGIQGIYAYPRCLRLGHAEALEDVQRLPEQNPRGIG